jgi:SAM-dependent methyltransferase
LFILLKNSNDLMETTAAPRSPEINPESEHFESLRTHFESAETEPNWAGACYRKWLAHYFNLLIPSGSSVLEIGCGSGYLLSLLQAKNIAGVDLSPRAIEAAQKRLPHGRFSVGTGEQLELSGTFDIIILSDTLNLAADVQKLLGQVHRVCHPGTRVIVNFHSALWRPVITLAGWLGLRRPQPQSNWLSSSDVRNLLELADFEVVKEDARLLVPVSCFGLDKLVNRWLAPVFSWFCLSIFCVARPLRDLRNSDCLVSVVIPARNEAGNIEAAVLRTPEMGLGTEIIFVEGNSTDHTWAEIQKVKEKFPQRNIQILQQPGKGKGDAVRTGFAAARGEILMILDADLTVPPEDLPKFYEVISCGRAEFANGVRLVYPMEKEAMRFLNLCANKAFGILFSFTLGQPIKDTLCGTKVLRKSYYERIVANRAYFGNFDPFGDFDLIFGAARLAMRIRDVPIRYRDRLYGQTNISRWKHGLLLARMLFLAARRIKFV